MRTAPIRSPLDGTPTPPPARPTDAVPAQRFADALRQQSARAAIGSTLRGAGRGDGLGLGADRAPIVAAPPPPPPPSSSPSPVHDAAPAPSSSPSAQRSAEAARAPTPPARHEARHDDAAAARSDAVASDAPIAPPAAEPGAVSPAGASGTQEAGHPSGTVGSADAAARAASAPADIEITANAAEPAAGATPGHAKRPAADAAANDATVNPWLAALAMPPPMPSAPVEAAAVATPAVAVAVAVDVAVPVDGAVATPGAGVEADRRGSAMVGASRTLRAGFGKDADRAERAGRLDRAADDRVVALPASGALPDFQPIAARDTDIAAAAARHADLAAPATPPAGVPVLPPGLAGAAPAGASAAHLAASLDAASSTAALSALRAPAVAAGAENRPAPPVATLPVPFGAPQFADALGAQVSLYAASGVQQAELRLNPAETGPIHIQIALDGTQARVDFHAAAAATRQAIEAGLPALAAALRDQGLTLAGGGVFDQSSRRGTEAGGEGRRDGAAEGGRRGDRAAPAAPAIGATAGAGAAGTQRALRGSAGRLDVYA